MSDATKNIVTRKAKFYLIYNMLGVDNAPQCTNSVIVFKSKAERDIFLKNKNSKKYKVCNRDEAFIATGLNEKSKKPCVYKAFIDNVEVFMLSDIRGCYGSWYEYLNEF